MSDSSSRSSAPRRLRRTALAIGVVSAVVGCRQGPASTAELTEVPTETGLPVEMATLRVELATPGHAGKKLFLAAAQTPDGWLKAEGWTAAKSAVVTPPTTVIEFESIPARPTAISGFIDVNADEELERGLFGIPTEPWGFSNNLTPFFGAPRFEDAVIEVEAPLTVTEIRIRGGAGGGEDDAGSDGDDR